MKMIFKPMSRLIDRTQDVVYVCVICGKSVLLNRDDMRLPLLNDFEDFEMQTPLWQVGLLGSVPCVACTMNQIPKKIPKNFDFVDFRSVFHVCDAAVSCVVARSTELLSWRENHQYCGHCGGTLSLCMEDVSLCCSMCSARYYPQIAPAVIVLIKRGPNEILLAHNRNFTTGVFSLIAGFVETGESAEQAIHREILEEIGIEVTNIQYVGSQCWPYPNSLMLGFTADYLRGNITPDGTEIETAAFFARDSMPLIPKPGSIASKMIMDWLDS